MPRSRRKPPRKRERRFLLLFGLAVMVLAALIVVVAHMQRLPHTIMPPESAEIAEKRMSPDNAFFTLREAWSSLPPLPLPATVKEEGKPESFYHAEVRSIGDLLEIDRPDDDPLLTEYLAKCESAIAVTRAALDMDTFLYPKIETLHMAMMLDGQQYGTSIDRVAKALTGNMLLTARFTDDDEVVRAYLRDALRLGDMLTADGSPYHYAVTCRIQTTALRCLPDAAAYIESPDVLKAMLEDIQHLSSVHRPMGSYMEYSWRMADNWAAEGFMGMAPGPTKLWISWKCRRYRQYVAANRAKILDAVNLSAAELAPIRETEFAGLDGVAQPFLPGSWHIQTLANARAGVHTAVAGASIALALELYRRDHGSYPDSLDGLSPDYLDSVPVDGYDGQPLIYRPEGDDYWLYDVKCPTDKMHRMRKEAFHCPGTASPL